MPNKNYLAGRRMEWGLVKEMVQVVLDGWQRLPDDKILGDFLYGGLQVAPSGKHEYTIHVSPVLCTLIQVKRRKR